MVLDYNSISIGNIQKENCLAFKQSPCTCNFFSQNPLLPLFFKVVAFPHFLRYAGGIDMEYHEWMGYDSLEIPGI